jgi:hypothetical protein
MLNGALDRNDRMTKYLVYRWIETADQPNIWSEARLIAA